MACPRKESLPADSVGFRCRYPKGADEQYAARTAAMFDHIVAIERAGRAKDGRYYTMSGRDMSELCAPIDDVFYEAAKIGRGHASHLPRFVAATATAESGACSGA